MSSKDNQNLTLGKLLATKAEFDDKFTKPFLQGFLGMPLVVDEGLTRDYEIHISPSFMRRIEEACFEVVEVKPNKLVETIKKEGLDLSSIPAELKEPYALRITSKYEGKCIECDASIRQGDIIYWNKRTSEVFCEGCGKEIMQ